MECSHTVTFQNM